MNQKQLFFTVLIAYLIIFPTFVYGQPQYEVSLDDCHVVVEGAIVREITESKIHLWAFDNVITIHSEGSCCDIQLSNISADEIDTAGIESYEVISSTCIEFSLQGDVIVSATADEKEYITFVACADADKLTKQATFEHIVGEISKYDYDMLIFTGDTVPSGMDSQFQSFLHSIESLPFPIHIAIGNHDLHNNSNEKAQSYYGKTTYSFDYGPVHFVMLDNAKSYITDEQFEWLRNDIESSNRSHTLVACHIPAYDPREGESYTMNEEDSLVFTSLMDELDVDVVLSGHVHLYDHTIMGEVEYIISGGAGSPLYVSEDEGGFFHYLIFHAGPEGIMHEVVKVTSPLYTPEIAYDKISRAEDEYIAVASRYEAAISTLNSLIEKGSLVAGTYNNMTSTIEANIGLASSMLMKAKDGQDRGYWHECISDADSAYSYAIQAQFNIDSLEHDLEGVEGKDMMKYYLVLIPLALIIVICAYKKIR